MSLPIADSVGNRRGWPQTTCRSTCSSGAHFPFDTTKIAGRAGPDRSTAGTARPGPSWNARLAGATGPGSCCSHNDTVVAVHTFIQSSVSGVSKTSDAQLRRTLPCAATAANLWVWIECLRQERRRRRLIVRGFAKLQFCTRPDQAGVDNTDGVSSGGLPRSNRTESLIAR
jgi:hypothetical protein